MRHREDVQRVEDPCLEPPPSHERELRGMARRRARPHPRPGSASDDDSTACAGSRIYTYRLPASYQVERDVSGAGRAGAWFQFRLGSLFHRRALAHRCSTTDPRKADLFFVPAWNGAMPRLSNPLMAASCAEFPRGSAVHSSVLFERLRADVGFDALRARGAQLQKC